MNISCTRKIDVEEGQGRLMSKKDLRLNLSLLYFFLLIIRNRTFSKRRLRRRFVRLLIRKVEPFIWG